MKQCAFILLLTFLGACKLANAQQSFNKAKLDSFLQVLHENNKMMGSFAIAKNGKFEYLKALGYKNVPKKEKATVNTKYRIGSVSKMYTATLIFQLIEDGKLTLNTRLAEFYPKIPNANDITIRHLLSHQSGLLDLTKKGSYLNWKDQSLSKEALLDTFRTDQPQAEPGSTMQYSNTNYILLGYIMEEITNQSYSQLLKKRILDKIGLEKTYFAPDSQSVNNQACSYRYRDGAWNHVNFSNLKIAHGAGGIVSTPQELTRFAEGLFNHELFNKESLDSMSNMQEGMGKGLILMPFQGKSLYGYTGAIDGFSTVLSYSPEDSVAFACTYNALNYSMNEILIGILSIYYGNNFQIPSFQEIDYKLPKGKFGLYKGVYDTERVPIKITVSQDGDQLTAKGTGQQAFPLNPTSDTTFKYERAGVRIKFKELEENKYQKLILYQGGAEIQFIRE